MANLGKINITEPIRVMMPENPIFIDLNPESIIGFHGQSIKHVITASGKVFDIIYRVNTLSEIVVDGFDFFEMWCRFVANDYGVDYHSEGRVFAIRRKDILDVNKIKIHDRVKVLNSYGEVLFSGFVLDNNPNLRMNEESPALVDWLIKYNMKPRAIKLLSDGTGVHYQFNVVDVPVRPGKTTILGTSDNPLFLIRA